MQIIECSAIGVRSVRLTLTSRDSDTEITLFPMVHVGEPDFYRKVYDDACSHDVLLVEGVKSPVTRRITRSYRWIEKSRTIGLVVQPKHPQGSSCGARIVHADLSEEQFTRVWRDIPLWQRLLLYTLAPVVGLERRWFGTREKLAEKLSMDDLTSSEELLKFSPETVALNRAIRHARDEYLIDCLKGELQEASGKPCRIAVVYGAAHMRAVIRELTNKQGYRVSRASWMSIFGF